MTRRFPIDPEEAELAAEKLEQEAPPRTRRRPFDKRWRQPHFDKSHAPASGPHMETSPDGYNR